MKFGASSSLLVTLALVCSSAVDAKYTEATTDSFNSLVRQPNSSVAVLFCSGNEIDCSYVTPLVDEVVAKNPPVTMVYVDIDKYPNLARYYGASHIPTFKGFNGGKVVNSYDRPMDEARIKELVRQISS